MSDVRNPRRRFRVEGDGAGRSLKVFLAQHCPEVPAGFLNKLLRKGYVSVDDEAGDVRTVLRAGQRVVLSLPEGATLVAPNGDVPFDVVHEDPAILVVDKPSGVVSEPGIGHKLDSLLNGLVARYGASVDRLGPRVDYGMVHRLDRETSGLLVVARTVPAYHILRKGFKERTVKKRYTALVGGRLDRDEGAIEIPLGRKRVRGRAVAIVGGRGAVRALTRYRVLKRFDDATLVEARPATGRWHQIRLHFAALGHPVAGDAVDGDAAVNERFEKRAGLDRLFLHAGELAFAHPEDGRAMCFESPLPESLRAVVDRLRT